MIVAGTGPLVYIDFGKDEPGMTLQRGDRKGGIYVWNDYLVDGQTVTAPIKIESLPPGNYRLV